MIYVSSKWITILNYDGTKKTTKVFAGGAVIAEQHAATSVIAAEVKFYHADPLTGNFKATAKMGAVSNNPKDREEYEALGQKVNPQSPQSQVPPSQYADYIGSASEPEWQCLNGSERSFWELPAQCKVAAAQKFSTAEFLAAINPAKERGNANKISEYADSPLPDYSGADEMLSYALTSSTKKDKKDKKKKRGGGGGEEKDDDVIRIETRELKLPGDLKRFNAEFGLSDASVSGRQSHQPQTDKQLVRTGLDSFLKNDLGGDCAAALTALKVSSQKLLNTFDTENFKVSKAKRFSDGHAETTLNRKGPSTTTSQSGIRSFLNLTSEGFLIHELVHAATKNSDRGIYNILEREQKAGRITTLSSLPVRKNKRGRKRPNTKADYSMALSTFFNNACQKSQSTPDDDEEDDEE